MQYGTYKDSTLNRLILADLCFLLSFHLLSVSGIVTHGARTKRRATRSTNSSATL